MYYGRTCWIGKGILKTTERKKAARIKNYKKSETSSFILIDANVAVPVAGVMKH